MTRKVRTALVVDDSRLARLALSKLLKKREVDVEMVGTGGEALDYLSNARPDVVFMDYMMPDMDGFEATRKIHGVLGDDPVPVVMYTSQDSEEDREKARQLGIAGFLSKPSGEDSLDEILQVLSEKLKERPRQAAVSSAPASTESQPKPEPAAAPRAAPGASEPPRRAEERPAPAPAAPRQPTIPWDEIRHVAREAAEALAGEHAERIARERVEPLRREVSEAVEESANTARRLAEQSARSAADSASREVAERIADRTARMIAQNVAEDVAGRVAREVGPEAAKRIIENVREEIRERVDETLAGDDFRQRVRDMIMKDFAPELRKSVVEQAKQTAYAAAEESTEALVRERMEIFRTELRGLTEETVQQRTEQLSGRIRRVGTMLGLLVLVGFAASVYVALYGLPL